MDENNVPAAVKIIDLSTDYREKRTDLRFVYGLPELNASEIEKLACCQSRLFATCIQLGLLPLAASGMLSTTFM